MSILETLEKNNEFPILFIGSGISKRYLENFPDWKSLINELWEKSGMEADFFGLYNNLHKSTAMQHPELNNSEINGKVNAIIGSKIHDKFNTAFNLGTINVDGFTPKDQFDTGISPFKKEISNRFKNYTIKEPMEEEAALFHKIIKKAAVSITTNYDTFIEDAYSEDINSLDIHIGQKGFFNATEGYGELFKIHGCITNPNSIIIDENDYSYYENNSVLISARIISLLIHSPIIFLGYSLSDANVRKFIRDFAKSITPEDGINLEQRIIVIDRKENCPEIIESLIDDKDLGARFTSIQTDNYAAVYNSILKIEQGVSPIEIRKYKQTFSTLIEEAGKDGALKSVLVTSTSFEEIKEMIGQKQFNKLAVALGDSKVIFQLPDAFSYIYNYITKEEPEISSTVALRYIYGQRSNTYLPVKRYLTSEILSTASINPEMKEKLENRLKNLPTLEILISKLNPSHQKEMTSISQIKEEFYKNEVKKRTKCYDLITFNFLKFNQREIVDFILNELNNLKDANATSSIPTGLRRLVVAYDIIYN